MILDDLKNADRYAEVHPGFAAAIAQLRREDLAGLDAGNYPIDGERLVLIIVQSPGRSREVAKLEAHRRYIDIHYSISADEEMGWKPTGDCSLPIDSFDEDEDYQLFQDAPLCWPAVPTGKFAVFFPEDAHAPLAGEGLLHKAVIKVAVDWTA